MKMMQVVQYCKEHGYPITAPAIYQAGKKYGFISKVEGKYHLKFNKDKFLEWFNHSKEKVPEGYISIKNCSEIFHLSKPTCYTIAKDIMVKTVRRGAGKGILYVNKKSFGEFINIRKFGTEEVFGE